LYVRAPLLDVRRDRHRDRSRRRRARRVQDDVRGEVLLRRAVEVDADVNVAEVVRYAAGAKSLFTTNPNVKKWFDACVARPAYRKMWAQRESEPA